jgi:hypothetical protein
MEFVTSSAVRAHTKVEMRNTARVNWIVMLGSLCAMHCKMLRVWLAECSVSAVLTIKPCRPVHNSLYCTVYSTYLQNRLLLLCRCLLKCALAFVHIYICVRLALILFTNNYSEEELLYLAHRLRFGRFAAI